MGARQIDGEQHPTTVAGLGLLVGRASQRMSRRIEQALGTASTGGPTLEAWRVLDLLADGGGHSMTEIATYALVLPPTLTKIADRLIDAALVYRRPDDTDRRRILVFLSERGREQHTALAPRVAAAEHEFVAALGGIDVAHLTRLLDHLAG